MSIAKIDSTILFVNIIGDSCSSCYWIKGPYHTIFDIIGSLINLIVIDIYRSDLNKTPSLKCP